MSSWKLTRKETVVATGVAIAMVGLLPASTWLRDFMLGHVPEAVARGLSIIFYAVSMTFLLEFWSRFFHGRKGPGEPFPYAKVTLILVLFIVIEVIRALL